MAGANMLSPGVQITEVDFSTYATEAAESTIGMIGGARKGPITPTLVTSKKEAIRIFGEPTIRDFGVYSLLGALDHSSKVYYRRIVKEKSPATAGDEAKNRLLFTSVKQDAIVNGMIVTVTMTNPGTAPEYADSKFNIKVELNELSEEYQDCTLLNVTDKINGISELIRVGISERATSQLKDGVFVLTGGGSGPEYATTRETDDVNFSSRTYDSTLNEYTIYLTPKDFLGNFNLQLLNLKDEVVEELSSLSTDPQADRYIETYVNSASEYLYCSYNSETEVDITDKRYRLSGGVDGISGLDADSAITGLEDFSNPEVIEVDILCTPGWSDTKVVNYAIEECELRQDCIFIIDPPFGLKPKQVTDWANAQGEYYEIGGKAFDSSYAALYWPWVKIWDNYTGDYMWLPPSGYVAGQMAYSDSVARTWYAPAGITRGLMTNIVDIEMSPSREERDLLYGNSNIVNPLMNYRGVGFVIWGQKTTQRKFSALDRINVRRLINYMKRIISASTMYFVFEPNDEYSWERWVGMIEPKLAAIKAARGLYDYQIIMDSTTVTPQDIDNNRMPGTIKFKPTKTAEFIPLEFMIMSNGASFDETGANNTSAANL